MPSARPAVLLRGSEGDRKSRWWAQDWRTWIYTPHSLFALRRTSPDPDATMPVLAPHCLRRLPSARLRGPTSALLIHSLLLSQVFTCDAFSMNMPPSAPPKDTPGSWRSRFFPMAEAPPPRRPGYKALPVTTPLTTGALPPAPPPPTDSSTTLPSCMPRVMADAALKQLSDPDSWERCAAMRHLSNLPAEKRADHMDAFVLRLDDADDSVRRMALRVLSADELEAHVQNLLTNSSSVHPSLTVQRAAVQKLYEWLDECDGEPSSSALRESLAQRVWPIRTVWAVPVLVGLLSDRDSEVRCSAMKALTKLPSKCRSLVLVEQASTIVQRVDDPDGAVRFAAKGALNLLPDETLAEYREELLCMLDDSQSAGFPDSYLSSILSAQPTNYAEAIVERLDLTAGRTGRYERRGALSAMSKWPADELAKYSEPLLRQLDCSDDYAQQLAIELLGNLPGNPNPASPSVSPSPSLPLTARNRNPNPPLDLTLALNSYITLTLTLTL